MQNTGARVGGDGEDEDEHEDEDEDEEEEESTDEEEELEKNLEDWGDASINYLNFKGSQQTGLEVSGTIHKITMGDEAPDDSADGL